MTHPNEPLGIFLKLLNLALFTTMSLLWAGSGLSTSQEMLMVCLIAVLILAPCIAFTPGAHFKAPLLWNYCARAFTGILAMWTWIEAIKIIAPNLATAFSYSTPFFCFLIGKLFFKERLPSLVFVAFGISVVGALVALIPHINSPFVLKGVLLSIASAICWALYNSLCKHQANKGEHFLVQAFYTFGFSALLIAPLAIYQWQPIPAGTLLQMSEISLCRVLNIIALFFAYRFAAISLLASFEFARIIFMAIGSYLVWQTVPTSLDWIGASLIFVASLMIVAVTRKGRSVGPDSP
jgi:drug/metabolite transporter (DMT)-like permease